MHICVYAQMKCIRNKDIHIYIYIYIYIPGFLNGKYLGYIPIIATFNNIEMNIFIKSFCK